MMLTPVEQARAQVLTQVDALAAEALAPADAVGRVLAQCVRSSAPLPPFDNAAMDGYAVALDGTAAAAGTCFEVDVEEQAAGDPERHVERACAIMTGAVLPSGLDTVVPVEDIEVRARDAQDRVCSIELRAAARPGQHVRRAGEDVAADRDVLASGELLTPARLMLLAALGIGRIAVRRRPRVAVLCTGRELVDDPGQPLASGQIRNSNAPFLRARLLAAGAEPVHVQTLPDEVATWHAALARVESLGVDLIVSTGAVSMGRHDFVPRALREAGAHLLFHRLSMRPGKPLLCARLASGALYFGLPGNPASTAVGLRFFVEPAVRALLGMAPEQPLAVPLAHTVDKKPGLTLFQKATLGIDARAQLTVALLPGQESFRIAPLAQANTWAELPAPASTLAAGTPILVHTLGHLDPPPATLWPAAPPLIPPC